MIHPRIPEHVQRSRKMQGHVGRRSKGGSCIEGKDLWPRSVHYFHQPMYPSTYLPQGIAPPKSLLQSFSKPSNRVAPSPPSKTAAAPSYISGGPPIGDEGYATTGVTDGSPNQPVVVATENLHDPLEGRSLFIFSACNSFRVFLAKV